MWGVEGPQAMIDTTHGTGWICSLKPFIFFPRCLEDELNEHFVILFGDWFE